MIRPIGEIFEFNGVKLQVVKSDGTCKGCYFGIPDDYSCKNDKSVPAGDCCDWISVSGSVIFKEVK
jgi:hypothetical protein